MEKRHYSNPQQLGYTANLLITRGILVHGSNSRYPAQAFTNTLGMSLLELLTSLALMGIFIGFTIFQFPSLVTKYKSRTDVDQFISIINIARHSAITRGINVTMCPLQQNIRPPYNPKCGKRNTWHNGTLVFTDKNLNRKIDREDEIIAQLSPLEDINIKWRAFRNRSYLRFTPKGLTEWQNGHFLFCPTGFNNLAQNKYAIQLVLNSAGRVYRSKDRDGDGIHEDVRGRPLLC